MEKQLIQLLKYVQKNVLFYQEKIKEEITNENIYEIYESLPIIDKGKIRKDISAFVDKEILMSEYASEILSFDNYCKFERSYRIGNHEIFVEYTSGTSGSPFLAIKSLKERIILGRYLWRLRNEICRVGQHQMFDFIHHYGNNRYPFPFERLSKDNERVCKEIAFLKESSYSWWHTNLHTLSVYDCFCEENHIKFEQLKIIENNGAYMSIEEKEEYANKYNCKIVDHYGCREVWTIAYECPYGHLHVCDHIILELYDDFGQRINVANQVGNIVITSLSQKSMPFIKYRLGDQAFFLEGECQCGKKNRRIVLVPGRHLIKGTNLYGNDIFRRVVISLLLDYGLKKYESINVVQVSDNSFKVNIKGNREDKRVIEQCFIEAADRILKTSEYVFSFTYYDDINTKSIFNVQ